MSPTALPCRPLPCRPLTCRPLASPVSHPFTHRHRYEVWKGALHWREWIERCGESLFFDAYRWAQQADPSALLCSSEASVLTTLTLTNAEAYHNLVYRLMDQGVPIKAVCVQVGRHVSSSRKLPRLLLTKRSLLFIYNICSSHPPRRAFATRLTLPPLPLPTPTPYPHPCHHSPFLVGDLRRRGRRFHSQAPPRCAQ